MNCTVSWKFPLIVTLLVMAGLANRLYQNSVFDRWAEGRPLVRDIVLAGYLMDFMTTGGGLFGPQTNYFAWKYAQNLRMERPWWSHLLYPESIAYSPIGYWVVPSNEWRWKNLVPAEKFSEQSPEQEIAKKIADDFRFVQPQPFNP